MSLASLKKAARSANPTSKQRAVDVDSFIHGAVVYAAGGHHETSNVVAISPVTQLEKCCPLKRATFTLGQTAIEQLHDIAEANNVSKSKMLRLLIAEKARCSDK